MEVDENLTLLQSGLIGDGETIIYHAISHNTNNDKTKRVGLSQAEYPHRRAQLTAIVLCEEKHSRALWLVLLVHY